MRFRVVPQVAWVPGDDVIGDDDNIYVMVVPDGNPLVLSASAALLWYAIVDGEDPVEHVAALTGLEPAHIADEASGFLKQLIDLGLIRPTQTEDR